MRKTIDVYRGIPYTKNFDKENVGKYWSISVFEAMRYAGCFSKGEKGIVLVASVPEDSEEILSETNKSYLNFIDLGLVSSVDYERYYQCERSGEPYLSNLSEAEVIVIPKKVFNQVQNLRELLSKAYY